MPKSKKGFVWKLFEPGSNGTVSCKFCNVVYKNTNATKMTVHILKCASCPPEQKTKLCKRPSSDQIVSSPLQCITNTPRPLQSVTNTPSLSRNNSSCEQLEQYVNLTAGPALTEAEKKEIDLDITKAVAVTGAPLSMFEHPLWKTVFSKLNGSYKLPSRKIVSNQYLDNIYGNMKQEIDLALKSSPYLHLQCDGWTNIRREGIINFLVSKPEPLFVKFLNTKDNRHTAQYICGEILKVMSNYGEDKFFSMVGDNAANLQKAFLNVKEIHPHIIPLRCVAHTLNLLCHDIIKCPSINSTLDITKDLIKSVQNNQVQWALFEKISKEKGCKKTLKLPCKTRWGSSMESLKRLTEAKSVIQALAVHEKAEMRRDLKLTILDERFWAMVGEAAAIFVPICKWIKILEGNQPNTHKVFPAFKEIQKDVGDLLMVANYLREEDIIRIKNQIEERKNQCIKPLHLAAHLLDPTAQGVELDIEEDLSAMEFIHEVATNMTLAIMSELANFKAKQGFWAKTFIWELSPEITPLVWWTGTCRSTNLSKIAARIFSTPITSAATERSFSTFGMIHTKKRNRLLTEKAGKIAFISYNWNLLHKNNIGIPSSDNDSEEEEEEREEQEMEEEEREEDDEQEQERDGAIAGPSTLGTSQNYDIAFVSCENNQSLRNFDFDSDSD